MKVSLGPWFMKSLLVAGFLAISTACLSSAPNQIAFVSTVDGDPEVILLNLKTGEALPLTSNGSIDIEPRLSPDGKLVAMQSDESGDMEINVVDPAAETIVRLTHEVGDDVSPRWSPDGKRLAFISNRDAHPEVYLMNADGTNPTRITNNATEDYLGDWSPDGIWLVFYSEGNEEEQGLWLRNPEGVDLVHLTNGLDRDPSWSPDGQRIVFVRGDDDGEDIYTVSKAQNRSWLDEPEVKQLTLNEVSDRSPSWSPDSKSIVFVSSRNGNFELYTMRAEGSKQQRLTNNGAEDLTPVWSQDGKRIAFVSYLYGEGEIFVMSADGSDQQRLTSNTSEDSSPDW